MVNPPHEPAEARLKAHFSGRKDYTRAVSLIVAGALCGAFWIAAAEAIVHVVRR